MRHRKSDIFFLLLLSITAVYLLWNTKHTLIKWIIIGFTIISVLFNELVGKSIEMGEEKKKSDPEVARLSYFFASFIYLWFLVNFCVAVVGIYISF